MSELKPCPCVEQAGYPCRECREIEEPQPITPCPFCGIGGSWRSWGRPDARENIFKCGNPKCAVQPKTISFATRGEALAAWNRRSDPNA